MCDPATIMVVTTLATTAYTADQQKKQGEYESGVAKYNQAVAENEAVAIQNQGTETENAQRQKTAELLSKQRAQLGAANVDLSSGSALQLQTDTQTQGDVDALRIRSNASGQAAAMSGQADLYGSNAEFAEYAGNAGAVGTLLSGGAQAAGVASQWYTPSSAANTPAPNPSGSYIGVGNN